MGTGEECGKEGGDEGVHGALSVTRISRRCTYVINHDIVDVKTAEEEFLCLRNYKLS